MYSLQGHGAMISDEVRMQAYERALRAAVLPGSVVADIGTGVGVLAILAARCGARRVYAIESSDMIEVARAIAAANGFQDRIEFVAGMSTQVELPERCDVIVSDLHGVLPYFQSHVASVVDARERFLARGGALIPVRETLWAACVNAPDLHRNVTSPWSDNCHGLDMSAARALAANQWRRAIVTAESVATSHGCLGTLEFASVRSPHLDASVRLEVLRDGAAHGICAWFDASLADGIGFSNAPGADLIYGNAFFPWPEALDLCRGDAIDLRMRALHTQGDYLWTWETHASRGGKTLASFRQSDFFSEPLAPDKVQRHAATHVARLGDDGRIDGLILALMGEAMPLGEIARRVADSYPGRFARWQEALARVAELSARYSGAA